ncbi:endolytic transglycosylase MltG [Rhodococcus chondri]|uniref:Endolytic murein transglycosylase n=1 Tax=Rhodococcus chondri TaxID=3065941 RepID=A0ABU7JXG8_9NOCA|nr:endolytic transglycosylase MltG [Rhodococcus sp. CC-R104]MEE2034716.1 endolytic transglycosylase MltG [Rhodococcus sp. CC-R104]
MSRHGRSSDEHPDAPRQGLFSDPYAGTYDNPPGRGHTGEIPHERSAPPAGRTYRDDDAETNVLHFDEGVFDGPPPGESYPEDTYPEQNYSDDVYSGGYAYARRDDEYDPRDSHESYPEPGHHAPGAADTYAEDYEDYEDSDAQAVEERAVPAPVGAPKTRNRTRGSSARRKRGRIIGALAVAILLVVVVGGGYLAFQRFSGPGLPPDFTGPAGPAVVVQVEPGETAQEIAGEFAEKGVVASASAFFNAAVQNTGMNSLQPGYYRIPTNIPAADAVAELVDPESRVGALVVSEGRQLHDIRDVNTGAVRKGIYTLIAEASCLEGETATSCLTYEELEAAGASVDLDALGVPEWAREAVANVPDRARQLEGLIAAGSWDFDPTAAPVEVLRKLVSESADRYEETGITEAAPKVGLTPYEMLVAASLVEREALPDDFSKVARVILNRLEIGQMLQFDSTVNYALDETELATTDADRARVTPWNTYASVGLPATPISSPSIGSLQAVENPEPGRWTYFVTIDDKGTTLFADSYDEHLVNTRLALESGILKSGR